MIVRGERESIDVAILQEAAPSLVLFQVLLAPFHIEDVLGKVQIPRSTSDMGLRYQYILYCRQIPNNGDELISIIIYQHYRFFPVVYIPGTVESSDGQSRHEPCIQRAGVKARISMYYFVAIRPSECLIEVEDCFIRVCT